MSNKSEVSLNTLLGMLIGQSKAEVKLRVKAQSDGFAMQITAPDLDITTTAQKVYVEVEGSEIDIVAGNFVLTYDEGAVKKFGRAPEQKAAPAPAAAPVRNRGSGSATNTRLKNDLG